MRSMALFAHLLGMLALFAALALEWVSAELLRAPGESMPRSFAVRLVDRLPRLTAIAVALILIPGIYLAAQFRVLRSPWVAVSFAAMVLMGALGGIALRPLRRGIKERDGVGVEAMARLASQPFFRASLRMRVCGALAIVYLMVVKPDLLESTALVGFAFVVGAAGTIVGWRSHAIGRMLKKAS